MPPSTENQPPDEPRFFPLWWWVIAAFTILIALWVTVFFLADATAIEVIDVPTPADRESTETPAG